jgi:hypothetical protein
VKYFASLLKSCLDTVSPALARTSIRNYAEPGGKFARTKPHLNIGMEHSMDLFEDKKTLTGRAQVPLVTSTMERRP